MAGLEMRQLVGAGEAISVPGLNFHLNSIVKRLYFDPNFNMI